MTPTRPKVFCVGFHKTGTKSLGAALATLGYRVAGPRGTLDPQIATNALPLALRLAGDFDAFQDNPWPILFKELDAAFPGSRFILTLREPAAWIASVVRHFGHATSPMREWIYGRSAGAPAGNEAIYLARHAAHVAEVRAHFAGRKHDLLEIDLIRDGTWAPLCAFLGHPVPAAPFPHANRAEAREAKPPL